MNNKSNNIVNSKSKIKKNKLKDKKIQSYIFEEQKSNTLIKKSKSKSKSKIKKDLKGNEKSKTKKSQSPKNIEYNQIMERYGNLLVDSIENLPQEDKNLSLNTFSYNNKILENKEINNLNHKDTLIRTYNSNKEMKDDDKENTTIVSEKEINLLKKQNEEILIESKNLKELIYNQNNRISNLETEINLVRELSKKIEIIMKEKSFLTEKIRCLEIENNSKDNIINYLEKITKIKDDNENKIINSDKISYNTNINTEKNSNTDNYFYDYSNTKKNYEDKKNYSNEDSKLKSEIDYFDKEIQNLYKVMNNINNI